ncbi:MAG: tetratricopeptide repeat protein [Phycisphaerales bacterium]|nr:tetratricopeptide repeat protein [Phycisphaerales bacterium]
MTRIIARTLAPLCAFAAASFLSAAPPAPAPTEHNLAPVLFEGMGSHTRRISTTSADAQRWFDQGLIWLFAFNHDEAIRSFTEAARHDPDAAMPWWGVAVAHGPHINNPAMPEERQTAAWEALQQANMRLHRASTVERALIEAVAARYAPQPVEDRAPLDRAYADAMMQVARQHAQDDDVLVLFAESMMDLRPWNLWQDDGSPHEGTDQILHALETVLARSPNHPGAAHLYIHAVEASPNPYRAVPAADALRAAAPVIGHLTHMPSHIDIRVGAWDQAAQSNRAAMEADRRYREASGRPPEFWSIYMAHNPQFLAFACMNQGREKEALESARAMQDLLSKVPDDVAPFADPVLTLDLEVLTQFGRWEKVLEAPEPEPRWPISRALRHHARGVALANLGRTSEAQRELEALIDAKDALPDDALMAINPAKTVLQIAVHKLRGEIALNEGRLDEAARELKHGVAIEDTLLYMEPPDWVQPMRRPLGAVLMKAGKHAEAEAVYREDLRRWPENGWSLLGLSQALAAQGKPDEAAAVRKRFEHVWKDADVTIGSSCPCVTISPAQ